MHYVMHSAANLGLGWVSYLNLLACEMQRKPDITTSHDFYPPYPALSEGIAKIHPCQPKGTSLDRVESLIVVKLRHDKQSYRVGVHQA